MLQNSIKHQRQINQQLDETRSHGPLRKSMKINQKWRPITELNKRGFGRTPRTEPPLLKPISTLNGKRGKIWRTGTNFQSLIDIARLDAFPRTSTRDPKSINYQLKLDQKSINESMKIVPMDHSENRWTSIKKTSYNRAKNRSRHWTGSAERFGGQEPVSKSWLTLRACMRFHARLQGTA